MAKRNRTVYTEKAVSKSEATVELGSFGLKVQSGKIIEDTIALLKGPNKIKMLEEMVRFDPTIGGVDKMLSSLYAGLKYSLIPADNSKKAEKIKKFIEECLFEDLHEGFTQVIADALTFRTYGFSLLEKVYKKRKGKNSDPFKSSKFNDGKFGISCLSPRYQGSIKEWIFSEDYRRVEYIKQQNPNTFEQLEIPYNKVLHFKNQSFNRNPEGTSLYQNCAIPYFKKKLASKIEDIRHERGFDGIFEMSVPANLLAQTSDPNTVAFQKYAQDVVENANAGKGCGHVKPSFADTKILSSNSSNMPDPDKIIARCDKDIAVSLLSDMFLMTQKSGSAGSFGTSKIKLFAKFAKALLAQIIEVLNNDLIMELGELNNIDPSLLPKLTHSEINDLDLVPLSLLIQSADKSGLIAPTPELSQSVLNQYLGDDAPTVNKDEFYEYQNRREVITNDSMDKANASTLDELDNSGSYGKENKKPKVEEQI